MKLSDSEWPATTIARQRRKDLLRIAASLDDGFTVIDLQNLVDDQYRGHMNCYKAPNVYPVLREWTSDGLLRREAETTTTSKGKTLVVRYRHYWID